MIISNQSIININGRCRVPENTDILKTSDKIPCRDPFIMLYDNNYYLYKTEDIILEFTQKKEVPQARVQRSGIAK